MKICQVGTGFTSVPPIVSAATEQVISNLCRELIDLGCDVRLIDILDKNRILTTTRLDVHQVPYFSFIKTIRSNSLGLIAKRVSFSFSSLREIKMMKNDCDVIHFHNQFPAFIFQSFTKFSSCNVPTIFTLHNGMWALPSDELPKNAKIKFALEVNAMNNATKVIAVSKTLKNGIVDHLKIDPSSVAVIPNGVDTTFFSPTNTSNYLQKKLAPNSEKIILCVGRICDYKGQKTLVNAIPKILKMTSNVKFVFAGPVDDIEYFKEIQEIINSKSLSKFCVFVGNISPKIVSDYISITNVFVLPSKREGLSLTLLEAMSSAKAVVATGIPQNKEVAKEGNEVIFVDSVDADELSDAIIRVLSDDGLMKRLGENARKTAVKYFDWRIVAAETLKLYENVVNS